MGSAELNENGKRVKHCFTRKEVMHRFIHSGDYVYSNKSYRTSGKYNWLFALTLNKNADENTITHNWGWEYNSNARNCIAVINRDIKAILVNTSFFKRSDELLMSIPDDYQVFLTDNTIANPHIFSTGELAEAIKLHAKYITKAFVNDRLSEFYSVIQGKKLVVHKSVNDVFKRPKNQASYNWWYKYVNYGTIYDFVKKYNVKKLDWYDTPLYDILDVENQVDWSKRNWLKVKCPSVKAIITNKVFNKREKLKLEQSYFYGLYCRGYGISRKKLEDCWNDAYNEDKLKALFDKRNIKVDLKNKTNLISWKDGIKLYARTLESNTKKLLEANIAKSNNNYNKAIDEYNNIHYAERLNSWRDFKSPKFWSTFIEYDSFVVDSYRYGTGHWIKSRMYARTKFSNVQLRYRKDKNNSKYDIVETSNQAHVTLEQAIKMYKLYKCTIAKDDTKTCHIIKHNFNDKHINVGLYNLRAIEYRQKQTDAGKLLDKWEYVVVIGCHHIWIDDFIDFVKYYNLEAEFGIN